MVRPKEVLVVVDEDGLAVEEVVKDVQNIQLYDEMKDILVFLTHIDQKRMDECI
jgi:exportin-1